MKYNFVVRTTDISELDLIWQVKNELEYFESMHLKNIQVRFGNSYADVYGVAIDEDGEEENLTSIDTIDRTIERATHFKPYDGRITYGTEFTKMRFPQLWNEFAE